LHTGRIHSKKIRSPFEEFERRFTQNLRSLLEIGLSTYQIGMFDLFEERTERLKPYVSYGNAQNIPLSPSCVDLVVTSPPYASNAIDYMRAHKFSLVWFGYSIDDLAVQRKKYIGSEGTKDVYLNTLPPNTMEIIERLSSIDRKKGLVLHRYYSEMRNVVSEMLRVLKPGGTAVFVVGNSKIRGQDVKIPECLGEIGESLGFLVPRIGVRQLDRNRRMMPAGANIDTKSQIQQRMHEEYVIGFYKPLREFL
jgi:SAM-dependent methyltransferase